MNPDITTSPAETISSPPLEKVAAVIVNYNAGPLLAEAVRSALLAGVSQVCVVDNHSTDQSLEHLAQNITDKRVQVIKNTANLGFASACNIGIQASSARFMLFLNPDGALTDGALARLLAVLKSRPDIGMVGGLLCNPDGSEQPGGRRVFPTPRRAFVRAFGLSLLSRQLPNLFADFLLHQQAVPEAPTPVEAISGACMLVKREAIDAVGMWDEGYFLHCEDLDWCMRFQRGGWQIVFVPDAQVFHAKGACSRKRPWFVEWHKHRGMLRFYRKFFRKQYSGLLWWLVVVGVWVRFTAVAIYLAARRLLGRDTPPEQTLARPSDVQPGAVSSSR